MPYHDKIFPFKPFKSKRTALRAQEDLVRKITATDNMLTDLKDRWHQHSSDGSLSLVIQRQGAPILRWRQKKNSLNERRYVTLFSDDTEDLQSHLSQDAISLLCTFEHQRIMLNLRSKTIHATLSAVRQSIKELDRLPKKDIE